MRFCARLCIGPRLELFPPIKADSDMSFIIIELLAMPRFPIRFTEFLKKRSRGSQIPEWRAFQKDATNSRFFNFGCIRLQHVALASAALSPIRGIAR